MQADIAQAYGYLDAALIHLCHLLDDDMVDYLAVQLLAEVDRALPDGAGCHVPF